MRRSLIAGIAAGTVLVAAGGLSVATADYRSDNRAASGSQQSYGPMGPGMGRMGPMGWVGPMGWMRGPNVDSEFDYLAHMVTHHEEAVAAARQLARSSRPEMRRLGAAIVMTQTAEIARLKSWLAAWYPDRSPSVTYRPMMRDLSRLSGDELEATFLPDMIHHHMEAVMMSQRLLGRRLARHDAVTRFAGAVRDEQHAEILQMQWWLASWFAVDRR